MTLLNEMADTVGLVMQLNGDDPSRSPTTASTRRSSPIQEAVDNGQIRQFTGNDYTGPLAKGDLIACVAWSGDLVQLQADNPSLKWVVPDDGGMIWTDNMLIPLGGDVEKASTFMNFVYDPEIAAQIAAYVNYVTPVKGAKEVLAKTDPELADNQLIFPNDATLAKVKQFNSEALNNQDYIEKWQSIAAPERAASLRGRAALSFFHRHRWAAPFALLAPGRALARALLRPPVRLPRATSRCSPGSTRTSSSPGRSRTSPRRSRTTASS